MRRLIACLPLLFFCCVKLPPTNVHIGELRVANLVMDTWMGYGHPFNRTCWMQVREAKVITGAEQWKKYCPSLTPRTHGGKYVGCHTIIGGKSHLSIDEGRPLLARQKTLAHEYLHLLGHCSGLGTDKNHVDEVRWKYMLPHIERELELRYDGKRRINRAK